VKKSKETLPHFFQGLEAIAWRLTAFSKHWKIFSPQNGRALALHENFEQQLHGF